MKSILQVDLQYVEAVISLEVALYDLSKKRFFDTHILRLAMAVTKFPVMCPTIWYERISPAKMLGPNR